MTDPARSSVEFHVRHFYGLMTVKGRFDRYEIEASALADHRELGMLWSPMGITRAPSKLIVRGRLVRAP